MNHLQHLQEEVLIRNYYGEERSPHLDTCAHCRRELAHLAAVLDAAREYPVPEPEPNYEQILWQKIAPELRPVRRAHWWQSWATGPALACLLLASFFIGRWSTKAKSGPTLTNAISDSGRQRILLVALGDHLERSQMVLVEIANAKTESPSQFHLTQLRAQDLVGENRLYRQTAQRTGDTEFTDLLDELERVLTDIANRPSDLSSPELEQIQRRIESRGLIFKVRVTGSNLQQKGSEKL